MSQISYDNAKYAEKNLAFNRIRDGASALRRAKAIRTKVQLWNPATREGTGNHREKIVTLGRDIGGTAAYFDNKRSSALEVVCEDKFTVHYQLYGDIGREAVHGQNTLSIFSEITWERCEVRSALYPGSLATVQGREKLVSAAREGIPNRDDVAKVTGWSRDAIRALPDSDMSMFKTLLNSVIAGQSKLTRLVKGFLMLLECMERDSIDVTLDVQNFIVYNPANVINSFRQGDRAYVYNSAPRSNPHTAVLWRMCGEYPPPELAGSHVYIPADAGNVFMVLQGELVERGANVHLTPGLIYASIMTYAMDVSCTEHLQEALIIACSLQQNRYLSRVRLPTVVSTYDLMIPGFMQTTTRMDKPILTRQMAVSIGRLHQMLTFMNIKDILTAAELSTSAGFNPVDSMRSYLSSQATLINQMAGDISSLKLLEATLHMKVHEELREEDFSDILNISAFEGLWLCDENVRSVENGVLAALTNGVSDMSGNVTSFDVVKREMDLGRIVYNEAEIPHGSFTIRWVCVTKTENEFIPPVRRRISRQIALVHPCNKVPGSSLRSTKKKRFGPKKDSQPIQVAPELIPQPFRPKFSPPRPRSVRAPTPEPAPSRRGSSDSSIHELIESSNGDSHHPPDEDSPPPKYESPESTKTSSSKTSSAYERSRIAHEALTKLTGQVSEAADARAVKRVVGDVTAQVSTAESVKRLRDAEGIKLSHKEIGSLALLIETMGMEKIAANAGKLQDIVNHMERKGAFLNYTGEGMTGNSKIAEQINKLIDIGSTRNTFGSMRREMLEKKVAWDGDIESAPPDAIRYVVNSPVWLRYLEDLDISYQEKDEDSQMPMNQILANIISRSEEGVTVKHAKYIHAWVHGATAGHFPGQIAAAEIEMVGPPDTVAYKVHPASFGQRKYDLADSRWLVMACRINRAIFDKKFLINLTKEFHLTPNMISQLRATYGLFKRE